MLGAILTFTFSSFEVALYSTITGMTIGGAIMFAYLYGKEKGVKLSK